MRPRSRVIEQLSSDVSSTRGCTVPGHKDVTIASHQRMEIRLQVDGIHEFVEELRGHGAAVNSEPKDRPWARSGASGAPARVATSLRSAVYSPSVSGGSERRLGAVRAKSIHSSRLTDIKLSANSATSRAEPEPRTT